MSSAEILKLIQVLLGLIELAQSVGIDVSRVAEKVRAARAEGRELTDDELLGLKDSAQASIDAARQE